MFCASHIEPPARAWGAVFRASRTEPPRTRVGQPKKYD